jgi:hypothetical protein
MLWASGEIVKHFPQHRPQDAAEAPPPGRQRVKNQGLEGPELPSSWPGSHPTWSGRSCRSRSSVAVEFAIQYVEPDIWSMSSCESQGISPLSMSFTNALIHSRSATVSA